MKDIRCLICGTEFTNEELGDGVEKCPNCGTDSIPCDIKDDVTIKINWHELRILSIWAENWAKQMDQDRSEDEEKSFLAIMTITQRLQKQFPNKSPLTLFGEMKELRKEFGDKNITTNLDNEELLGLGKM